MRNKMKDFIKQPKIYQQTDTPFWTDDYISQKMLENHLDPSIDGASRNRSFIKNLLAGSVKSPTSRLSKPSRSRVWTRALFRIVC